MMHQNYTFYEDKIWIGEFEIGGDSRKVKVVGELIYKKNQVPYLEVSTLEESFLVPFVKPNTFQIEIGCINGYVKDQKNKELLYATLTKCMCRTNDVGARQFRIYFSYAFFSKDRFFSERDELVRIDYFFNNWDEFNHAKGWKSEAKYKFEEDAFKLKSNLQVKFCQSVNSNYLFNEDKIFDRLFCSEIGSISEKEIGEINDGLKSVLSKYLGKIFIKDSKTHRWFISLGGNLQINNIPRISYYLVALITCLTKDFGTSLEEIIVFSRLSPNKASTRFNLLYCQPAIKTQQTDYNNLNSALRKTSFNDEEWRKILDNLFEKIISQEDLLDNFFFILQENHLEDASITPFHITRLIDCLDGISRSKDCENEEKYQTVVSEFLKNLDEEIKNFTVRFIDEQLDYVMFNPKIDKCTGEAKIYNDDQIRGKKISELRAISVHFGDKTKPNKIMDLNKASKLLYILELIIIDFIFEKLQVPQEQRNEYKKTHLKQLPWI